MRLYTNFYQANIEPRQKDMLRLQKSSTDMIVIIVILLIRQEVL
jgi:hypothetical protein